MQHKLTENAISFYTELRGCKNMYDKDEGSKIEKGSKVKNEVYCRRLIRRNG